MTGMVHNHKDVNDLGMGKIKNYLVGGFTVVSTHPSEKYEFVSWDDDIPNWMESHNPFMFQINMILMGWYHHIHHITSHKNIPLISPCSSHHQLDETSNLLFWTRMAWRNLVLEGGHEKRHWRRLEDEALTQHLRRNSSEPVRGMLFLVRRVCLKMSCTPTNPMVLLIIIPSKWLFHWGYTPFSDIPRKFWASVAEQSPGGMPTANASAPREAISAVFKDSTHSEEMPNSFALALNWGLLSEIDMAWITPKH